MKRREETLNTYRKTATIVGVLYITATVAGILGLANSGPVQAPDYLTGVSEGENQVIAAVLFTLIMAVAVAGIAVALYPVLKRHSEALALGYISARVVEGMLFIVAVISWLLLLILSRDYVEAGAPDASYFQTLGGLLRAVGDWVTHVVLDVAVSPVHYTILYSLLYRSRLVPRWLSGWGLVGVPFWFAAGVSSLFGSDPTSTLMIILNLPIALNEMVLAVWLIVKGFNPSAFASGSAE
jgi:hypothetical protein